MVKYWPFSFPSQIDHLTACPVLSTDRLQPLLYRTQLHVYKLLGINALSIQGHIINMLYVNNSLFLC